MNSIDRLLEGRFGAPVEREALLEQTLPRSVVTHTQWDELAFDISQIDSPRFREMTLERAPEIHEVAEPEPIDAATVTAEELTDYQEAMRAHRDSPMIPVPGWADLVRDVHYGLHTTKDPEVLEPGEVDPDVRLNAELAPSVVHTEEFRKTRRITAGDRLLTEIAEVGLVDGMHEAYTGALEERAREQEEVRKQRERAQELQRDIDAAPADVDGAPSPRMGELESERDAALEDAQAKAEQVPPLDLDQIDALAQAAEKGQEAAEQAKNLPRFGAGQGDGEPVYESAEQAYRCAKAWSQGRMRAVAEMFGKLDPHVRFLRATRVEGGADEIVDVEFGAELRRVLPQELALLGDPVLEDDFISRYAGEELLQFATIGEANAGRGPVVLVVDGSGSMAQAGGKRLIFSRAVALCLLHLTRLDKRDFAVVEFGSARQVKTWFFPARAPLSGELVLDMASHFWNGGTAPIAGIHQAARVMREAPEFKKADIVICGDGEAPFGANDERLRDEMREKGVRIFGMAVGREVGEQSYLHKYSEHVVRVEDFDLDGPSDATAQLATHIT